MGLSAGHIYMYAVERAGNACTSMYSENKYFFNFSIYNLPCLQSLIIPFSDGDRLKGCFVK